ncbi:GntR family transcriptional regulator [Acetobacterium tundrae]|uniref:GntR family transcriptional regulator n=1 Tax=Acetobacterium tundrae TaxID=132932 RepID=A0ABR6WH59_9FIRM|nr:GntR family transcriptional regulator [Acetobacterium tundrae]MBC3795796.1 GntR family transcriptional regulator [Acetobacterium tundrae]
MNIIISNSSDKPIYEQIATQIKKIIISGEVSPGDALPSMRFLAKELRISVITTKRAYSDLERDGFIETVAGKGSFVANQNLSFIREEQLRLAEEFLQKAVDTAKNSDITCKELKDMLEILYGGEEA